MNRDLCADCYQHKIFLVPYCAIIDIMLSVQEMKEYLKKKKTVSLK